MKMHLIKNLCLKPTKLPPSSGVFLFLSLPPCREHVQAQLPFHWKGAGTGPPSLPMARGGRYPARGMVVSEAGLLGPQT